MLVVLLQKEKYGHQLLIENQKIQELGEAGGLQGIHRRLDARREQCRAASNEIRRGACHQLGGRL
jgi:hypothetical protein